MNEIKYPITVYNFGCGNTVEEITFDAPPKHHFDCHYIKGNKLIESNYDINYESYLNREDAENDLRTILERDILREEAILNDKKRKLNALIYEKYMKTSSKTPYIIVRDYDHHSYLIPAAEEERFNSWALAMEEQRDSEDNFNFRRVELNKIRIYGWEE